MTDRGRAALQQTRNTFQVGPSKLTWAGGKLVFDIDEMTWPHMGRLKGRVTVTPSAVTGVELPLKADGTHIWRPFGPSSEIEVDLNQPGWQWTGHGYFDANFGTAALEDDFSYWTWGRFPTKANGAWCFYDASVRDGSELALGVHFDANGRAEVVEAPPRTRFARSKWLVRRETRADPGYTPRQVHDMLDAPFYCRSAIRTKVFGEEMVGVHEALDLDRFASPLIKPMLAVKVPRKPGWPSPR